MVDINPKPVFILFMTHASLFHSLYDCLWSLCVTHDSSARKDLGGRRQQPSCSRVRPNHPPLQVRCRWRAACPAKHTLHVDNSHAQRQHADWPLHSHQAAGVARAAVHRQQPTTDLKITAAIYLTRNNRFSTCTNLCVET